MSEQSQELSNKIGAQIDAFIGESAGGGSVVERVQTLDDGLQSKILWGDKDATTFVGPFSNAPLDPLLDDDDQPLLDESGQPLYAEGETGLTFGSETWLDVPLYIHAQHQKNVVRERTVTTVVDVAMAASLPEWVGFVILRVTANILLSNWSVNGAVGSVANIYNRITINGREAVENDLDHTMWEWVRLAGDRSIFTVNLGYTNSDIVFVPLNGSSLITITHVAQNTSRATAVVEVVGYGTA